MQVVVDVLLVVLSMLVSAAVVMMSILHVDSLSSRKHHLNLLCLRQSFALLVMMRTAVKTLSVVLGRR